MTTKRTTTDAWLDRLRALAVRRNLSLGIMHSANRDDFALVMAAAAHAFVPGDVYTERAVNERLQAWLAAVGAMIAVDHVELRRWLVDTGVLARDGFGRAYTRGGASPDIAAVIAALDGRDLAVIATQARAQESARREARKSDWTRRQQGTG